MGTKEYVEWGFGYGKSDYEVSFRLAPRNGDLTGTPEHCKCPFPDQDLEWSTGSRFPQSLGSVGQSML